MHDGLFEDAAYIDRQILTIYRLESERDYPEAFPDNTRSRITDRLVSTYKRIGNYVAAERAQEQLLRDLSRDRNPYLPDKTPEELENMTNAARTLSELYLMFHRRVEKMNIFLAIDEDDEDDERINVANLCLYVRIANLDTDLVSATFIDNDGIVIPKLAPAIASKVGAKGLLTRLLARPDCEIDRNLRMEGTALVMAAKKCHVTILDKLVKVGADLEARDIYNKTPLMCAALNRSKLCAQILLKAGADVNATSYSHWGEVKPFEGDTALHFVAERNDPGTICLLLANGAAVNAEAEFRWTPLMRAIEELDHRNTDLSLLEGTMNALIKKGANLEARDTMGRTPISLAVSFKSTRACEVLLENGAAIETRNEKEM